MSRFTLLMLQLLVAIVAVLLWQLFTSVPIGGVKLLPPFFFSTPIDVATRIVKWFVEGTIWKHLWITLIESVLAFVIGSLAGILTGFWFAQQPLVAAVLDPYVKMINALPRVVLAPIFARWLGMSERALMRHVYWPSALSWMFSSLHTAVGFAVVGAVVGEYLGSAAGLGYIIQQAEGVFDVAGVFAGMLVLAAFVIVIDMIVTLIEKRLLVWRPVAAMDAR